MTDTESSAVPRPRVNPVALADLCRSAGLTVPSHERTGSTVVSGVVLDSRAVRTGDLYGALPGHRTHGSGFAAQAVASGAVAILTDPQGVRACGDLGVPVVVSESPRAAIARLAARVHDHPASRLGMVGVTGTNGKTTVAAMVEAALRAAGRVTGVIGTTGVRIQDTSFPGLRTTPESTDLQALLARMEQDGVECVVMEASSIAVAEHRLDALVLDVVGFTNLSQDHLDYHGTMEDYFAAKAQLFTPAHARRGIVGVDDEWGRRLASSRSIPVQTWSATGRAADWTATVRASDVMVHGPQAETVSIHLRMPGTFNAANALCAYALARAMDVPAEAAAHGIGTAVVPGRMQVIGPEAGVLGVVDYAHTPDAIERVLEALRDSATGRIIAVLGAGGDRDRGKRPLMGAVAARLADVVVVTDDNPRSEDPALIRAAVLAGVDADAPSEVHEVGDRRGAITVAVDRAEAGDVIVVLGKGHEQGQEARGVVTPFDDAAELSAALERRRERSPDDDGPRS